MPCANEKRRRISEGLISLSRAAVLKCFTNANPHHNHSPLCIKCLRLSTFRWRVCSINHSGIVWTKTASLFYSVYKIVSFKQNSSVKQLRLKEKTQKWLKRSINDPIAKTLAENSHLTKTQLETLLIDALTENIAEKSLKYEEKAKLRISAVSRGAFNRTLRQAKKNVIQSVYTILLLGYLGVLESTLLDPYIEIANKLQTYMSTYREALGGRKAMDEYLTVISMLRKDLETSLEQLSKPKNMSGKM